MKGKSRSYAGAPRVYLTYGVHDDGEWKRMWFCNECHPDDDCVSPQWGHHFWAWEEAIAYALSIPVPEKPRPRR